MADAAFRERATATGAAGCWFVVVFGFAGSAFSRAFAAAAVVADKDAAVIGGSLLFLGGGGGIATDGIGGGGMAAAGGACGSGDVHRSADVSMP